MSSYRINGTSFNDDISVDNYYALYPDGTSWEVYGHGGDDLLDYYFTGRALSGILSGGDGNDLLFTGSTQQLDSRFPGLLVAIGGDGTDSLVIFGSPVVTKGPTIGVDEISFTIEGGENAALNVNIHTSVESIIFTGDQNLYYLTEDLYQHRIVRTVDYQELHFRTYGENSDWAKKQLNTYSQYHLPAVEPEAPSVTPSSYVFRLFNQQTGRYLFSSNETEIDIITGIGWYNEGIAHKSPGEGGIGLHRFSLTDGSGHFYTANTLEKVILDQNSLYSYEGVAFQVYEQAGSDTVPVVRFLNTSSGVHLYSTSSYEQEILNASSHWLYEGIAWYGEAV